MVRPISGLAAAETTKPNEKAPAVMPRSHPNSSMIGGKNSENAVRALTPIAMGRNVTAMMIQPQKKGSRIEGLCLQSGPRRKWRPATWRPSGKPYILHIVKRCEVMSAFEELQMALSVKQMMEAANAVVP